MKKPTAVKIVEVLGWMEVVLVLYGVIWAVNAILEKSANQDISREVYQVRKGK